MGANWNLSVELRGKGQRLATELRTNAALARDLGAAAREAQGDVDALGNSSRSAARHVRSLGSAASGAANDVKRLGTAAGRAETRLDGTAAGARRAAKDLRKLERDAAAADTRLRGIIRDVDIAISVDDRTATGISDIATTLGTLRALSPLDLSVRLDDDTTTGIAGVASSVASLAALSPVHIRATFDGDTAEILAAAAALRDLRDDADRTGPALGDTAAASAAATAALRAAKDAAQELSRALRTLRARAASTARALEDLADQAGRARDRLGTLGDAADGAHTRLGTLGGSTRTLRTDMDDLDGVLDRVGGRMDRLRGSLGTLNNAAGSSAGAAGGTIQRYLALGALATSLIPIAASLAPIVMGLGAGALAVGVFTLAIGGQITAMTEASEAQTKYDDAVRKHGKASKEAADAEREYLALVAEMPPATREAAAALSVAKDAYQEWTDALADDTMPAATKGMQLFTALLPELTPLARGAAGEVEHLFDVLGGAMTTPGFDAVMAKVTEFAVSTLAKATHEAVVFSQALDGGEIGSDYREFMDYAREVGPMVGDTLGNLAKAVVNLLIALSDMGVSALTVINVIAELFNAIPPEALGLILQAYTAYKLLAIGIGLVTAAASSGAVAQLGAWLLLVRTFGAGATLRATAASLWTMALGMSAVAKAGVGLAVLAGIAYGIGKLRENARGAPPDVDKLTTSLKNLAMSGKFTGELKSTYKDLADMTDKMKLFREASEKVKETAEIPVVGGLTNWIRESTRDLTKGSESYNALREDLKGVDEALAQLATSGGGKQAAEGFRILSGAMRDAGMSTSEINEALPQYKAAVADLKAEQALAAAGMGLFGEQAIATKSKLDAQKASADGLRQALQALNEANRAGLGGQIAFEAAIDAAAKAAQANAGALEMTGGKLDLSSEKARNAATALSDLGAKTDEAAAAARESGASWETVNGIYVRGQAEFIKSAQAMGLTRGEAERLAASILKIPDKSTTVAEMNTEDATSDLATFNAKVKASPGAKSVTLKTLSKTAETVLREFGYKVTRLPDGSVTVSAKTGAALSGISGVAARLRELRDRTVTVTTRHIVTSTGEAKRPGKLGSYADGGVVGYYADGGVQRGGVRYFAQGQEDHVAQFAPAGSWRVWAEPETGGEAYIPLARSKRRRSRQIAEETIRRLGGKGVAWQADGSVLNTPQGARGPQSFAGGGFSYTPSKTPVLGGTSDPKQRLDKLTTDLKGAWSEYNAAVKELAKLNKDKKASKAAKASARAKVVAEREDIAEINAKLGNSKYAKAPAFNLGDYQKQLGASVAATDRWRKSLTRIAGRGGQEVADLLESMGEEGYTLVNQLAGASDKQFQQIVANLQKLSGVAKATIGDYTAQLTAANKIDAAFAGNLAKLAGMGYGSLATQLAEQGDTAAQQVAADAVKSSANAAKANTAAANAAKTLSGSELADLVQIIAAVKTSATGLHDVADTTGIGEDTIVAVANKASTQIKGSLGARADKFLADLARANKGLSYAFGGIREGVYSTKGGAVTFAEPSTGGEAFIPLGANRRHRALPVLREAANRLGVGLADAAGGRVTTVIRQGGDVYVTVKPLRTDSSASDIGAQVGRSVRRASRGGVNARG